MPLGYFWDFSRLSKFWLIAWFLKDVTVRDWLDIFFKLLYQVFLYAKGKKKVDSDEDFNDEDYEEEKPQKKRGKGKTYS